MAMKAASLKCPASAGQNINPFDLDWSQACRAGHFVCGAEMLALLNF